MNLPSSKVYKCLDKKTLILGFEITDLFALMLVLAILSFITGNTAYKALFTWIPVAILGAVIRIAKRGKPDQFIIHWLKYQLTPGVYWGFFQAETINKFLLLKQQKRKDKINDNEHSC